MPQTMINIHDIITIAHEAGKEIMDVYHTVGHKIEYKSENSPLTFADTRSHVCIVSRLNELYPHIPVLSEEGKDIPYDVRKGWEKFWLVDPLDGTKEFIKRNGEFTVNIALIRDGAPVMAVVYAPVLEKTYWAEAGSGSYFANGSGEITELQKQQSYSAVSAVKSRTHSAPDVDEYLSRYTIEETVSIGSSLKFCLVAEGKAQIYPRLGPTMEWDTAAGQCIAESAGASVLTVGDNNPLRYNKKVLRNPGFVVFRRPFILEGDTIVEQR